MFQIEVWKLQEYFVYPQGACRIRTAEKPQTAAQYFKIFKPISWGERPAERRSRFIQRFLKETQKPRSPVAEGLRCCPVHGLQHRLHGFYSMRLPDLSLRGGQRPTWQSRSTRLDNKCTIGKIAAACTRLPRRFAPRNDTSGWYGGAPVLSCR